MGPNRPTDWLANCSESLTPIPVTPGGCCPCWGIVGFVSRRPRCHLIHPLSLLLFCRAWSMRLDLQCNWIEHIVSQSWWWGGYRSDKAPDLLSQKKVDQKVWAEDSLCFSWALAAFTQGDEAQTGSLCVEEEWGRVEGSGTPGWRCTDSSRSLVSSLRIRCQKVAASCWGKCSASPTVVASQWASSLGDGMHLFLF